MKEKKINSLKDRMQSTTLNEYEAIMFIVCDTQSSCWIQRHDLHRWSAEWPPPPPAAATTTPPDSRDKESKRNVIDQTPLSEAMKRVQKREENNIIDCVNSK